MDQHHLYRRSELFAAASLAVCAVAAQAQAQATASELGLSGDARYTASYVVNNASIYGPLAAPDLQNQQSASGSGDCGTRGEPRQIGVKASYQF